MATLFVHICPTEGTDLRPLVHDDRNPDNPIAPLPVHRVDNHINELDFPHPLIIYVPSFLSDKMRMDTIITLVNDVVYGIGWPLIFIVFFFAWIYFRPRY